MEEYINLELVRREEKKSPMGYEPSIETCTVGELIHILQTKVPQDFLVRTEGCDCIGSTQCVEIDYKTRTILLCRNPVDDEDEDDIEDDAMVIVEELEKPLTFSPKDFTKAGQLTGRASALHAECNRFDSYTGYRFITIQVGILSVTQLPPTAYNSGTPYETIKRDFDAHMKKFRVWLGEHSFTSSRTQELYYNFVHTMLRRVDIREPEEFYHLLKTEYSSSTHNGRISARRKYLKFMGMPERDETEDTNTNGSGEFKVHDSITNRKHAYKVRQSLKRAILNFLISKNRNEQSRWTLEAICADVEDYYKNMLEKRAAYEVRKDEQPMMKMTVPKHLRDRLEDAEGEDLDKLIVDLSAYVGIEDSEPEDDTLSDE